MCGFAQRNLNNSLFEIIPKKKKIITNDQEINFFFLI